MTRDRLDQYLALKREISLLESEIQNISSREKSRLELMGSDCSCECDECKLDCRCRDCTKESKWKWRGPQGKAVE